MTTTYVYKDLNDLAAYFSSRAHEFRQSAAMLERRERPPRSKIEDYKTRAAANESVADMLRNTILTDQPFVARVKMELGDLYTGVLFDHK